MKIGRKVPPRGGNGKLPGGIPPLTHHHDDGLDPDRTGKPAKISESSIYLWHESHKEFGAKFTVIISVTVNAVHCHRRGGVKSTSPVTDNHYTNGYENCTTSTRAMRTTSMTHITSTSTRTQTTRRASCTCEHGT